MPDIKTFKVSEIKLDQQYLIEASAGTGKTYSLAILALRQLLEKKLKVEELLVVTYTTAAVAELQLRVRAFLVNAKKYLENGNKDVENEIKLAVESAIALHGREQTEQQLRLSLYTLEQANVLTIHSFCQQMLNEFPFLTKQYFAAVLQPDIEELVLEVLQDFWRKEITTLPVEVLELMGVNQAFFNRLKDALKYTISGVHYPDYEELLLKADLPTTEIIKDLRAELDKAKDTVLFYFENEFEAISEFATTNGFAKKCFPQVLGQPEAFLQMVLDKIGSEYIQKLPESYFEVVVSYQSALKEYNLSGGLDRILVAKCIRDCTAKITKLIAEREILTYDGMIQNLHRAVVLENNEPLQGLIRARFKAVFIDEFQDTDVLQFEIFEKLFVQRKDIALFLIGDPKQSIYGFRGADVDSYLKARNYIASENVYSMQQNFRSNAGMIESVNTFFESVNDPFEYAQSNSEDLAIDYVRVISAAKDHQLKIDEENAPCLNGHRFKRKDFLFHQMAADIKLLLTNQNACICGGLEKRKVSASDIGVLVMSRKDGSLIRDRLSELGIPAVLSSRDSVMNTSEAKSLLLLLSAVLEPSFRNIRRALFLSFIAMDIYILDALTDSAKSELVNQWKEYQTTLDEKSVFEILSQVMTFYNIRQRFASDDTTLRALANTEQILLLINNEQQSSGKDATEILLWLHQKLGEEKASSDEFALQLESDENAVKIVTVHSSKGLEYGIVFTTGLEKNLNSISHDIETFKDSTGKRLFKEKWWLTDEEKDMIRHQNMQEQRRLMYVAITRAKYACNVYFSKNAFASTVFGKFAEAKLFCDLEDLSEEDIKTNYELAKSIALPQESLQNIQAAILPLKALVASKSAWWRMSYSGITTPYESHTVINTREILTDYDRFVFQNLGRGKLLGDELHQLLEQVDFMTDFQNIPEDDYRLHRQLHRLDQQNANDTIDYSTQVAEMLHNTTCAVLDNGKMPAFTLKEISSAQRLVELEFFFDIDCDAGMLLAVLQQHNYPIALKDLDELSGILNGKIDLFFEHKNKYFILDWKSNYLGDSLQQYENAGVTAAMTQANYHLQYLIYTLAVHKFLKSRLMDYDYNQHFGGAFYLFLRGLRAENKTGVFCNIPSQAIIIALDELISAEPEIAG